MSPYPENTSSDSIWQTKKWTKNASNQNLRVVNISSGAAQDSLAVLRGMWDKYVFCNHMM